MATTAEKTTSCCIDKPTPVHREAASASDVVVQDWGINATDHRNDKRSAALTTMIRPVDGLPDQPAKPPSKGY